MIFEFGKDSLIGTHYINASKIIHIRKIEDIDNSLNEIHISFEGNKLVFKYLNNTSLNTSLQDLLEKLKFNSSVPIK